jgi:hypothetical protein
MAIGDPLRKAVEDLEGEKNCLIDARAEEAAAQHDVTEAIEEIKQTEHEQGLVNHAAMA